jgi:hypothetical protein
LASGLILGCTLFEDPDATGNVNGSDIVALAESGTVVNGKVYVVIDYPGSPTAARTLIVSEAEDLFDYYEVIFKTHSGASPAYYTGTANKGEVLSAAVDPGNYDVLLLAGRKTGRVLLASAFSNTAAGYDAAGTGFNVAAGKANNVILKLEKIESNPVNGSPEQDFRFELYKNDGTTLITYQNIARNYTPGSPYNGLLTLVFDKKSNITGPSQVYGSDAVNGKVVVKITTHGIDPLLRAQTPSSPAFGVNTFKSATMSLDNYYTGGDIFLPLTVAASTGSGTYTPDTGAGDGGKIKLSYTTDVTDLPDIDAYGKLYFEIKYTPFSDAAYTGNTWSIRNGLDNTKLDRLTDSSHEGGAVLLIIGDPDPGPGVLVEIPTP